MARQLLIYIAIVLAVVLLPRECSKRTGDFRMKHSELLAQTMELEAASEGYIGMVAVGSVVMNRVADGRYGIGINGVILRPSQFSCYNSYAPAIHPFPQAGTIDLAEKIIAGYVPDPTGGATHYCNPDRMDERMLRRWFKWVSSGLFVPTGNIGKHYFFIER